MIALAAPIAQTPLSLQWAQFSRSGALSHIIETVDIATGDLKDAKQFEYRLRFTNTTLGPKWEIKWTDSMSCPAVRVVIAAMHNIAMPSPAPYGVPGETTEIIIDGTEYSLTAPSSYSNGKLTITSNIGSALAVWVDTSLKLLAPCWKTTAP